MSTLGKIQNEFSIEYKIEYDSPIELNAFSRSLSSFSSEYKKFIIENYGGEHPTDAKLHIKKIEEGSIITTLVEYASNGIPFIGDVNTVYEFGIHLKLLFDYFKNKSGGSNKPKYDIQDLENLSSILTPATDYNNCTTISVNGSNNNILVLDVGDNDANAMINRITAAKKELAEPNQSVFYNQAFYWEQAKKDIGSKSGNYGVIEAINPNRLKVIFDDASIKKQMIRGDENPFKYYYIVDVELHKIRDQPKIYKIVKLHEIIEDEEGYEIDDNG